MTRSMQFIFGSNSIFGAITGFIFTRHWIGAIVGLFVGAYIDGLNRRNKGGQNQQQSQGHQDFRGSYSSSYNQANIQSEFSNALLVLSAEVMKADGKIIKAELDFVKQFLVQQFGRGPAQNYLLQLKTILQSNVDLATTCARIKQFLPPQQRSMLLQYLFGIAQSDGNVSASELNVIKRIAQLLGISEFEYNQLQSMFWKDATDAYKVLGIDKSASDQEIKKAYRKMAIENHPDKVASLGEQHQKAANEKFQKIQEAYETVRKERGL